MISRRQLIKLSVTASGSLLLQIPLSVQASGSQFRGGDYFDAWLEITAENKLIFILDKVEMGQGVINSLVTILAEEISTDPLSIDVQLPVVGQAQRNTLYKPSWGTGASASINTLWPKLRKAGATLNTKMLAAAALRWGVDSSTLIVRQAKVINPGINQSFDFSELASDVAEMDGDVDIAFKSSVDYEWIGKQVPERDMLAKVTGEAIYCSDLQLENLPVAVVIRCPYPGGSLTEYQWRPGFQLDGINILELDNSLVLVGPGYHLLSKARTNLELKWQPKAVLPSTNEEIKQRLLTAVNAPGETVLTKGNRFTTEDNKPIVSATYLVPYLAHAPLETMNCTVLIDENGSWTLWAPTQKPALALKIAVKISGLAADKVSVHTPYIGGGFGRRLRQDYVTEACLIAKALGHSIKVLWSREDDFQHGFYRPAIAARLAVTEASGGLGQFHCRIVSPADGPSASEGVIEVTRSVLDRLWRGIRGQAMINDQAIDGLDNLPYKFDKQSVELSFLGLGVPTGLWRSVGNSFNGFFVESFIDELALHYKTDPVDYRLSVLSVPAMQEVLMRVRELSSWDTSTDKNVARGVACYQCFGTSVAMVVEVAAIEGRLVVPRVWCAIDCGLAIDPEGIKKQVEGATNYGLCAALFGELKLSEGRVSSSNFNDYPVLRMQQAPEIIVEIIASENPPTGVGEPATPLVAPALCNALFALTGLRIRELPVSNQLQGQYVL